MVKFGWVRWWSSLWFAVLEWNWRMFISRNWKSKNTSLKEYIEFPLSLNWKPFIRNKINSPHTKRDDTKSDARGIKLQPKISWGAAPGQAWLKVSSPIHCELFNFHEPLKVFSSFLARENNLTVTLKWDFQFSRKRNKNYYDIPKW